MVWCLAEALREQDRDAFKRAQCIGLFRDERKARLALRYVACDEDFRVTHAHFGIRKNFGDWGAGHHESDRGRAPQSVHATWRMHARRFRARV